MRTSESDDAALPSYRATHTAVPTDDHDMEMGSPGNSTKREKEAKNSENLMSPAKLFAIVGSIVSSVGIVMVNKLVLNGGFPFASTLTAFHQLVAFAFSSALIKFNVIPPLPAPLPEYPYARYWISGLMATGIVLMNQSLSLNSVAFYQLLKMSCIPAIAVLQFVLFKRTITARVAGTLAIVLFGIGLASLAPDAKSDPEKKSATFLSSLIALLVSVGAVLTTSLSQIELNQSPDLKRLNSFQSMNVMSIISFYLCSVYALFVDVKITVQDLIELPLSLIGLTDRSFFGQVNYMVGKFGVLWTVIWTEAPLGWILISSLMAVFVVVFAFSLIKGTSAITFQVVGHLKTILTLVMGAVLFGANGLDGWKGVGVLVALVGMVFYSIEKM
ncbi:hypothetical protein HDU98_009708 [Podochytrium sp. JEL0797]|nr:hypothetical protein HDU98_009708 [Podochytrium sp. JEL0797]